MSSYEMIRSIPAKSMNWSALASELTEMFVSMRKASGKIYERTLADWADLTPRRVSMEASILVIDMMSREVAHIPPTEETLAWGGFLGGSTEVWTNSEKEAAALEMLAGLLAKHRKGSNVAR